MILQMERRLGRELTSSEKHLIGLAEELLNDDMEVPQKAKFAAQGK